jgi:hypothetical protein
MSSIGVQGKNKDWDWKYHFFYTTSSWDC